MKFRKECDFVKRANEELKEEVISSRIEILESSKTNGEIDSVLYKDRFGREFKVYKNKQGIYVRKEIKND